LSAIDRTPLIWRRTLRDFFAHEGMTAKSSYRYQIELRKMEKGEIPPFAK
jgi:hypothetical protein